MSDDDFGYTLVEYCGEHNGYRCGYCKTNTSNYSHGMWSHKMTCPMYQTLIDRGWRRSGRYCYKPTVDKTCCPQYTIRCDAQNFRASKSQKKVLKRFHSYLSFGSNKMEAKESDGAELISIDKCEGEYIQPQNFTPKEMPSEINFGGPSSIKNEGNQSKSQTSTMAHCSKNNEMVLEQEISSKSIDGNLGTKIKEVKPGVGADPSKPLCKKAKLLRKAKYEAKKAASSGGNASKDFIKKSKKSNEPKALEEFFTAPLPESPAHKLEIRLVHVDVHNEDYLNTFDASFSVYKKYQMGIHENSEEKLSKPKYQRFLCNSPLQFCKSAYGPPKGYGSFHQQYWLDGELVAVGVLDILPDCVSSVYLYYNPKYSFLSLGTYSSLREIALARELSLITNRKVWYYMGFYIHSCPKMRYKGQYYPSQLLCPETYNWVPIEKCIPKLEIVKYSRFYDGPAREEVGDVGMILCLYKGKVCRFQELRQRNSCDGDDVEELKQYLKLVGNKAAATMILYRG